MKDGPVKIEAWRDLHSAAEEFRNAGCWDVMWDTDVFGVKDPASGKIGYCCVMGHGGEHFGLGVYLGAEGLEGILRMQDGDVPANPVDMLQVQDCIMASFEDRKLLWPEDLDVIVSLGLKFRGRNAWPLFRSYRPGYVPWLLTGEEAKFLTLALRETICVSGRFATDPDMLDSAVPGSCSYLVRVPRKDGNGLTWKDEWLEPVLPKKGKSAAEPVNDALLQKVIGRNLPRRGSWEIGSFRAPQPVREKDERPFFPIMTLFVERGSGFIRKYHMESAVASRPRYAAMLLGQAEEHGVLPVEIFVDKEEVFNALHPVASKLGIRLGIDDLSALEDARESMNTFLGRR